MDSCGFFVFCLASFTLVYRTQGQKSTEQTLIEKLFTDYDKEIFPAKTQKDSVKVDFGMTIVNLLDLDVENQALLVNAWIKMKWIDYRLTWSPEAYENITHLRISDQRVWRPDIVLYNNAKYSYLAQGEKVNALVYSDGTVLWIPPKQVMSHCAMDMRKFPYDQHKCKVKFGSWTYDGFRLDLSLYENRTGVDLNDYYEHNEWQIVENTGARSVKYYNCCAEPYPDITYNLTFVRQSSYYCHVYVAPAVILTFLIPITFLMPPGTGEKTTLGCGILICLVLLLQMMEGYMPAALSTVPIISLYYSSSFILMGISIIFSTWTSSMWWRRSKNPPPDFLSKICTGCLGKILCVNKDDYQSSADPESKTESSQGENKEWKIISIIVDRILFVIFFVLAVILSIAYFA